MGNCCCLPPTAAPPHPPRSPPSDSSAASILHNHNKWRDCIPTCDRQPANDASDSPFSAHLLSSSPNPEDAQQRRCRPQGQHALLRASNSLNPSGSDRSPAAAPSRAVRASFPRLSLTKLESVSFSGVLNGDLVKSWELATSGGSSEKEKEGGGARSLIARMGPRSEEAKMNELFNKYKSEGTDAILTRGTELLCKDLELAPDDFLILVFAWKCRAKEMCKFTRSEFLLGCKSLKADSIGKLSQRLPEAAEELKCHFRPEGINFNPSFRDLYKWSFSFGLEDGQRILALNMAVSLWSLVFIHSDIPLMIKWLTFLQKYPIRGIPYDTWSMFLNFIETVGHDLSIYDESEAWPCIFDDFVEHEIDEANQNTIVSKD